MENNLPTYKISINPEHSNSGEELKMDAVAFVNSPAILTKGIYLNAKTLTFKDNLKGIVAAPAMIPDLPIYRFDNELGEYNVIFDREVIAELRSDFMKNKGELPFNLEHSFNQLAPAYILDSWITGPSETDQSFVKYGIVVPEGSWFVVTQFTDMEYFMENIVNGDRAAYSIEGFLGLQMSKINISKINKIKMEENKMMLPDGEHRIGEKIYVIVDGIVTEIKEIEVEVEEVEVAAAVDPIEEVKEEEEEVVEPVEPVTEPEADNDVQKQLDEMMLIISELKTKVESLEGPVPAEQVEEVEMSRFDKLNFSIAKLKNLK